MGIGFADTAQGEIESALFLVSRECEALDGRARGEAVGFGDELAEIGVAGVVLGQQGEMGFVGERHFRAGDGEDSGSVGGFGEFHGAVDTVVIGDCQGAIAQLFGARDHLLREGGSIEKGEGSMQMEFDVVGFHDSEVMRGCERANVDPIEWDPRE
ncbi:MAG: hypothetical protein R2835_01055 [Thermomicrobiales bacterium]